MKQDNCNYEIQDKYPRATNQKGRFVIENQEKGDESNGKEYMYNDVTAGIYQEFEVIKIKKDKSRQERVIGVDMYNFYNSLPKNKTQLSKINIVIYFVSF